MVLGSIATIFLVVGGALVWIVRTHLAVGEATENVREVEGQVDENEDSIADLERRLGRIEGRTEMLQNDVMGNWQKAEDLEDRTDNLEEFVSGLGVREASQSGQDLMFRHSLEKFMHFAENVPDLDEDEPDESDDPDD